MVITMISGMFFLPMVGVISAQLKRIPGISPALTYAQIATGGAGSLFFFLAPIIFLVAVYRPDRPAELTYLMYDFGWIMAVLPWPPAFMQCSIRSVQSAEGWTPESCIERALPGLRGSVLKMERASDVFTWDPI